MGGVKGWGGKGKSTWSAPTAVMKPLLKPMGYQASATSTWGAPKGKGKQTTWSAPAATTYAKGYSSTFSKGTGKSWDGGKGGYGAAQAKGYGKSTTTFAKGYGKDAKGKGKGKTKGKPAPPADDPFWEEKMASENRVEGDGSIYIGTVQNYNIRAGWGFIQPEDPTSLPENVQAAITKASEEAAARGKNVGEGGLIYFRKPDISEGATLEKGGTVTFQVYVDDKGAGAFNIAGV
mmetsp:Transcript_30000/g.64821  ORF Transcript_30000/g.64821 Transcript_30000/m.64821 type:complete len:234 (-) Transcript_30000:62-763(-)|eukprot:CAMPEP_0206464970 /NCGR_PEP_ID=MMETSP0324_2-20121206/27540_1 /ASSEMBLY_ACC=CAM_ASM_000836 /TAXON_ID=2866 /ORGANISM="Crypthecodinium cohnii, Strain Seligo" /LENGTH=233 /DNA_ID=CAMNT_0053937717 /DNA_START=68 /DNA_END=769 /DNA_ORIENTATION=+